MDIPNVASAKEFAKIVLRKHKHVSELVFAAYPTGFIIVDIDVPHFPLMINQTWRDEVTKILSNFSIEFKFEEPIDRDMDTWVFTSKWRL